MKNKNKLIFDINHKSKIINISQLEFFIEENKFLRLHYDYKDFISIGLLNKIFKFLSNRFSDYEFWWIHYMEFISTYETRISNIIDVFRELKILNKLKFYDNNLKKTKFIQDVELIGVPTMFGFTYDYKFEIKERKFDKKFICLNRVDRVHRKIIFDFLYNNYKNESYLSYTPHQSLNKESVVLDNPEISKIGSIENAYTSLYQTKSFCNIVNETLSLPEFIHITEKTDKCFSAGQPFIINAGPYYIKKLKEYGFKTFDKWWDESYDGELNDDIRIEKIKKNIEYISSLSLSECEFIYKEMIPTLIHNQKLCYDFSKSIWHIPTIKRGNINVNNWIRTSLILEQKKSEI